MLTVPSEISIASCASIAQPLQIISIIPPVILTVSLPEIPLSVDLMISFPGPLIVRSSFEKITASVFVLPSLPKSPVTDSLQLPSVIVIRILPAFLT